MAGAGFRPGPPSIAIAPEATLRIDLRRPEEEILQGVHPDRRRRIRVAMRNGVETVNSDDVEAFHRLHVATARRQGFPPIGLENLKAHWEVLAPLGRCQLFITRYDGVPTVGWWVIQFAGVMMAKFTGSDLIQKNPAARDATSAAIWACVVLARQEGARRFDFGAFDRKSAEGILAGQGGRPALPARTTTSSGRSVARSPCCRGRTSSSPAGWPGLRSRAWRGGCWRATRFGGSGTGSVRDAVPPAPGHYKWLPITDVDISARQRPV
jgi:hypothetical protein